MWGGLSYDFGKRVPMLKDLEFDLAYYASLTESTRAADGTVASAGAAGRVGTWSALLDYKLNKRFDVYGAYTNNSFSGPTYSTVTNAGAHGSQDMLGMGVRMKF